MKSKGGPLGKKGGNVWSFVAPSKILQAPNWASGPVIK